MKEEDSSISAKKKKSPEERLRTRVFTQYLLTGVAAIAAGVYATVRFGTGGIAIIVLGVLIIAITIVVHIKNTPRMEAYLASKDERKARFEAIAHGDIHAEGFEPGTEDGEDPASDDEPGADDGEESLSKDSHLDGLYAGNAFEEQLKAGKKNSGDN